MVVMYPFWQETLHLPARNISNINRFVCFTLFYWPRTLQAYTKTDESHCLCYSDLNTRKLGVIGIIFIASLQNYRKSYCSTPCVAGGQGSIGICVHKLLKFCLKVFKISYFLNSFNTFCLYLI